MHLTNWDFFVLAIYFIGLFLVGVVAARKQHSLDDYFLGNRRTHWLLAGVSIIATILSTLTYLSLPGEMSAHGITFFLGIFSLILVVPLINYFIIPTLMKLQVASVYDYLEQRYSLALRMLGASIFILTRLIWIGIILYTASNAVQKMTDWNILYIAISMGAVTTLYTTIGGFRAVVWSDFAQFLLLFGGAVFIPCSIAWQTDSTPVDWWHGLSTAGMTTPEWFSTDFTLRLTVVGMVLELVVWNLCTHSSDQLAAQRYLSTPSLSSARRSVWVCTLCNAGIMLLLGLCGLGLFYLYVYQPEPNASPKVLRQTAEGFKDNLMPRYIATSLPSGITGLILAAILAAAMSSVSSGVNSISTVFCTDFIERLKLGNVTKKSEFIIAQVLAVLTGAIGIGVMVGVDWIMREHEDWNLVELVGRVNHLFVAPLGAVFLCGILFKRPSAAAAWIGFIAGAGVSAVISFSKDIFDLESGISFTWILPTSLAVSMLTIVIAGVFLPRKMRLESGG